MACLECDALSRALRQRCELREAVCIAEGYGRFGGVGAAAEGARLERGRIAILRARRPFAVAIVAQRESDPRLVCSGSATSVAPWRWSSLTNAMLVGATCVVVIWIRTPSHIRQETSVSATVYTKTRIIRHTIVACAAACLVAECIVAARDEAAVKLVAGGGVACAVAHEDVGAHGRVPNGSVLRCR